MGRFDKLKEQILNSKTELKLWQKIVTVLSCFAVFVTVYSLILPAITINTDDAELIPGFTDPSNVELNSEPNDDTNVELDDEFNYEEDELLEDDILIDELSEENIVLEEIPLEEIGEQIDEQEISKTIYIYICLG